MATDLLQRRQIQVGHGLGFEDGAFVVHFQPVFSFTCAQFGWI
jgi:hypothetical protein